MKTKLLFAVLFSIVVDRDCVAGPLVSCNSAPLASDALQYPSKHAWDLFIALVHPAMPIDVARGEPDCSEGDRYCRDDGSLGDLRLARTEVFKDDGSEPPEWRDLTLPRGYLGQVPGSAASIHTAAVQPGSVRSAFAVIAEASESDKVKPFLDPFPNNGVFDLHGGIGETHLNC